MAKRNRTKRNRTKRNKTKLFMGGATLQDIETSLRLLTRRVQVLETALSSIHNAQRQGLLERGAAAASGPRAAQAGIHLETAAWKETNLYNRVRSIIAEYEKGVGDIQRYLDRVDRVDKDYMITDIVYDPSVQYWQPGSRDHIGSITITIKQISRDREKTIILKRKRADESIAALKVLFD